MHWADKASQHQAPHVFLSIHSDGTRTVFYLTCVCALGRLCTRMWACAHMCPCGCVLRQVCMHIWGEGVDLHPGLKVVDCRALQSSRKADISSWQPPSCPSSCPPAPSPHTSQALHLFSSSCCVTVGPLGGEEGSSLMDRFA